MSEPMTLQPGCRQLFVDDHVIEATENIRRTLNRFEKDARNPVLVPDKPWEGTTPLIFGSVIRDVGNVWRMWYFARFSHVDRSTHPHGAFGMAYAESSDGIHWRKPPVGVVEFGGTPTNIVVGRQHHRDFREVNGVIRDDTDPDPARRYKTVFHTVPLKSEGRPEVPDRRYSSMCSPDGIHWSDLREIPTQHPIKPDIAHLSYDPKEKQYVLWARAQYAPEGVRKRAPKKWFGRAVSVLTSDDFTSWEDHGVVMAPDMADPPAGDIYSLAGVRQGDLWIGLVQFYYQDPDDHRLDIQLASSRDGRTWTRFADRSPILRCGDIGEWDRFNQSIACELVDVDDEEWLYYAGRTYRHRGCEGSDSGPAWSGIGVARLRRDGFVSLDASFDGGHIVTKPLKLPSANVFLNVKADYGRIAMEAADIDGVILAKSIPLAEDSVRAKVRWTDEAGLDALTDRPVRLRLHLENAKLYALWVE